MRNEWDHWMGSVFGGGETELLGFGGGEDLGLHDEALRPHSHLPRQ
jgi:hypothetical protein